MKDGEHSLGRSVGKIVVAHEEHAVSAEGVLNVAHITLDDHGLVGGVQFVRAVHHEFGVTCSLVIVCLADVHLAVQVQASQKQVAGVLVDATPVPAIVAHALTQCDGGVHLVVDVEQLALDELIHLGARSLAGLVGRYGGGKRHIAPAVHQEVVVESAKEAHLGSHHLVIVAIFLQIVVAERDGSVQTIVETSQHGVVGIVSVEVELRDTIVTPAADCLIGGEFVSIPHLAHIARRTAVDTVDVAAAIGSIVAGHADYSIALVEHLFRSGLGGEVRVDGSIFQVKVVDTRRHSAYRQQQTSHRKDIFINLFHDHSALLIRNSG